MLNKELYEFKSTNFMLNYLDNLYNTADYERVSEYLSIDKNVSNVVYLILKGTSSGDIINISLIISLYKNGFNYHEIGTLKQITKMGVRHHLTNNLNNIELSELKHEHKKKRKEIKDFIFSEEVFKLITPDNYEEIRKDLGYSESYFNLITSNFERKHRGDTCER